MSAGTTSTTLATTFTTKASKITIKISSKLPNSTTSSNSRTAITKMNTRRMTSTTGQVTSSEYSKPPTLKTSIAPTTTATSTKGNIILPTSCNLKIFKSKNENQTCLHGVTFYFQAGQLQQRLNHHY